MQTDQAVMTEENEDPYKDLSTSRKFAIQTLIVIGSTTAHWFWQLSPNDRPSFAPQKRYNNWFLCFSHNKFNGCMHLPLLRAYDNQLATTKVGVQT